MKVTYQIKALGKINKLDFLFRKSIKIKVY